MKLPSEWANEPEKTPVEQQVQEAIFDATGSVVEPILDGKIHRFKVDGDAGSEKSGWYVIFGDRLPAGAFGNWKDGEDWIRWHADGIDYSANREALEDIWRGIREKRDKEQKEIWGKAAGACKQIWEKAQPASLTHPYLQKKKVKNHGLRQTGDGRLIMPVYIGVNLASLQYIGPEGDKQFHPGGQTSGGYFRIPASEKAEGKTKFIAEGYATAASIHEATGCEVWTALNAGNLKKVGEFLRKNLPDADLCFVGDNDESGVGQKKAQDAADAVKARCVIMPERGDANDYAVAGKDLKALLIKRDTLKLTHWLDFCSKPQPIKWLIKGWLQAGAQMMVFGAPGSGKTFVVLDMALSIACPQIETWQGFTLKHGPVAYLAGEGYAGMKQRLAGWKAYKDVDTGDMFVSEATANFDTGDVSLAIESIESHFGDRPPCLIVIDTLIHFMAGDENKAQDTRNMLEACARLYQRFGCAVLLVHHTGVSQDAQLRARGSSAWRGAMDIEIAVLREDNEDFPAVTLKQTKNKDAELQKDLRLEQHQIDVPGWYDEDGEQVRTCVMGLSGTVKVEQEKALTENQNIAILAYVEAAKTAGTLDNEGKFAGLAKEEWRKVFYEKLENKNPHSQRTLFSRAIKDLLNLGWLGANDTNGNEYYTPVGLWGLWERDYLTAQLKENGGK